MILFTYRLGCFPSCLPVFVQLVSFPSCQLSAKIFPRGGAERKNFRHKIENVGRKPAGQTLKGMMGKKTRPVCEKDYIRIAHIVKYMNIIFCHLPGFFYRITQIVLFSYPSVNSLSVSTLRFFLIKKYSVFVFTARRLIYCQS